EALYARRDRQGAERAVRLKAEPSRSDHARAVGLIRIRARVRVVIAQVDREPLVCRPRQARVPGGIIEPAAAMPPADGRARRDGLAQRIAGASLGEDGSPGAAQVIRTPHDRQARLAPRSKPPSVSWTPMSGPPSPSSIGEVTFFP